MVVLTDPTMDDLDERSEETGGGDPAGSAGGAEGRAPRGIDADLARVAAVLLEDRVVRRVIKQHRELPGIGLQVPHARCYALPRADLERLVDRDELAADPGALPDDVVIFGGSRPALAAGDPAELSRAWRAIFHARVHQALDALARTGAITAASIRERIHRIGQTEFDEIRAVLRQDDLLLPPAGDTTTYVEFAALYLELRAFAPRTLGRTFPTLDAARVDAAIALDVDPAALLAASRPARAPERPVLDEPAPAAARPRGEAAGPEAGRAAGAITIVDRSARKRAGRARYKGNRARAAILSLRAGDRDAALDDLDALCERLARAVGSPAPGADWAAALLPVAEAVAADRVVRYTPGARLLADLQAACVVAERDVQAVDVAGWLVSRRRRPLVRSLPATREVRVAKHLHAAARKLAEHKLAGGDHERVAAVLRDIVERADRHVRVVLRPKIDAALDAVALRPRNLPERVAQKKLVDELLDRAVEVGQLSLGNLRDAISHSDLKLPDLTRARLRSGDELLRCDDALSRSLDGVYRRGESYLRLLQKISSVLFGTPLGRLLTLYLILPLLGSYIVFQGAHHMIGWFAKHLVGREPEIATPGRIYAGAAFIFLLLHVPVFRRAIVGALRLLGRGLRLVLIDLPRALLRLSVVRWALDSRLARWVIQPAVPAAVAWWVADAVWEPIWRWPVAAAVFAAFALGLNSRLGRRAQEIAADAIVRWSHQLTGRIVPGIIKWLLAMFAELIEVVDRAIYRVDEWLRFKVGQPRLTLVAKGALGLVWSVVAYALRFSINLFIEPEVNPIKHFPVVTVVAKILLPFSEAMISAISAPVSQLLGPTLGVSFAAFAVFILPGFAGFLVWEFKENWRLYRNTRPETLREVSIGHHGETMVGFLKPGFHSGTIPKRFTKLRRAAWKADERGVARHREELHHIEDAIRTFVDRELVSMLDAAPAFRITDVAVAQVAIGSNRVHIDLACPSVGPDPARIAIEQQSGWTVASIPERGWIDRLADGQRQILEIAFAGFYKRSGIDLVREQLEHALAGDAEPPPYDISDDGLVVWPGHGYQTEAVYNLHARQPVAAMRGAPWSGDPPILAGRSAVYRREPLRWSAWTAVWEQLARGEPPAPVVAGPSLIRRPPPAAAQLAG
jgi:hypothetical protein